MKRIDLDIKLLIKVNNPTCTYFINDGELVLVLELRSKVIEILAYLVIEAQAYTVIGLVYLVRVAQTYTVI